MTTVAVLDADERVVARLAQRLGGSFCVIGATDARTALDAVESEHADILVTDILGADIDGLGLVAEARRVKPHLAIIVVSTFRGSGQPGGGRVVYRYTVPGSHFPCPEDRARLIGLLTGPGWDASSRAATGP